MRHLILRVLATVVTVVGLFQVVIGVLPAMAATSAPARPGIARTQSADFHLVTYRVGARQRHAANRIDHELVVKSWANIRTAPTTVGNQAIGHFVWHSRFRALHRIVYGQHPYGPGSSNHWLKIASGRYRGDYTWAVGVVDPRVSRGPPAVARVAAHRHGYVHYRPHRFYRAARSWAGGGTLGCASLEALWRAAGGAGWAAFTAAEIAIAESGGRQYATGVYGERGYWQIHPSHGPTLSTYNAYGNARAAVIISGNGTNWSAWTTYQTGAYHGLCLLLHLACLLPRRSNRPPASLASPLSFARKIAPSYEPLPDAAEAPLHFQGNSEPGTSTFTIASTIRATKPAINW